MIISGLYSFKNGKEVIERNFLSEFLEIKEIVALLDSQQCKTKISKEKTMSGRILYSPADLNKAFKALFKSKMWYAKRIKCKYETSQYYINKEISFSISTNKNQFREIDFVKNRVGVEVQFGKYAFMVYDVCAKMPIFHNLNLIDVGIEIVPLKEFADEMSTGVSYFEQIVWDLETRRVADIDIPVMVLGLTA
ncbi:MAG: BglII/BstYI family type II restriction endonuclease [Cyanobacteriota bacterium]|nr:BglII/BstYI family type II restriction endonuclease [Cyanobacteriota bacterium]